MSRLRVLSSSLLVGVMAALGSWGCVSMGADLKDIGIVIQLGLAEGARPKPDLQGRSEVGKNVFGSAVLNSPRGGVSMYPAGFGVPKTVRVTWRDDKLIHVNEPGQKPGWMRGEIVGDYTIPVLSRIPKDVLDYALAARGRSLKLIFRIKDDGVLLAWEVEEVVRHPSGGRGLVSSMHGGEVPCEPSDQSGPVCTEGPLEKASWFNPVWTRGQ